MKRKMKNVVMSVLLIMVCAFAMTGCAPQENALRGVGEEQATKVTVYETAKDNTQKQMVYQMDGDKVLVRAMIVATNKSPERVTSFSDSLFWKDGDKIRCIVRQVSTGLGDIDSKVYSESLRNIYSDDSKYVEADMTSEKIQEAYDAAKAVFDVTGKAIGKEIDADKETYKGKGFKFATSNDVMSPGDFLEKAEVDGKETIVKRWRVEDKKLVYKNDALEGLSYSYSYDTVTVSVPKRFTEGN